MKDDILSSLLETAELKILTFDIHHRTEMNYRKNIIKEFYMMTYIRKGSAKLRVQNQIYDIDPGTVIFIPPDLEYDQYKDNDEETEFLWWNFTFKIQNVVDVLPLLQIPYIYPLKNHKKFEAVFDEFMLSRTQGGYISNIILQKAKSLELLYLLVDNAFEKVHVAEMRQQSHSFLSVLLKIVSQPEASFSLSDLAKELHMNPTYVSNRFKEMFGKSPILLHREIKIEKAKSLLKIQEMNMTEISTSLGFNDVQTFTRLFKKYTGISPSQYKGLFDKNL
ncbi:AraC family transcriptional regulator [Paenibacillus chitinolyticus]|uniref:AraC family transcriptional regulator n=1 Tax=Paenibacillus chitinolyticus TaxID=79263 RepID=A0A410WYG8_9BACL|nr:AraC family transcriptional regulator [Paenibacillus chitinolyticus]MCY9590648.1 AraC family transcriptional regulator [Paenibacillus chitinolyticus]MCY9596356.1 AraC family transcriptional regulator [Paenibacillus chitinolyticus]QAV19380.1 AraC family transcriptional regulator [Paenibacillus chitinolyticus]